MLVNKCRRKKRRLLVLLIISASIIYLCFNIKDSANNVRIRRSPSIQDDYVNYTTNLRHLKPILNSEGKQISSLIDDDQLGPVINDIFSFHYRLEPADCQLDYKGLLLIFVSAPNNLKERQMIRQSWNEQLLFLAGNVTKCQLIFLLGLAIEMEQQISIEDESIQHGDLVQVDFIDSYANLTLKSVVLLHWVHTRCPGAHFIVKSDDDNFINAIFLLNEIIPNLAADENVIYGTTNSFLSPFRDEGSHHYVSLRDWPWSKFPPYLMGGAYLLSGRDTVRRLLAAVQTTPYFPFEDTYIIGLCAPRVGIRLHYLSRFYQPDYDGRDLNPCMVRNMAIWNVASSELFSKSNDVTLDIYRRNLNCDQCPFGTCWVTF